jgi:4-hydroxy-2-oxoheptanedioate aldolase
METDVASLRERLLGGEVLVGAFCLIPHPVVLEVMGRAGFDFLFVDGEHAQVGRGEVENLVRAAETAGSPILFRFPGFQSEWVAWVLDAGANGAVVPRIETAAQARSVVEAARFPPMGKRGIGLSRAAGYGARIADYRAAANQSLLLVIMVETAEGLANIEEIAAVEGIDAILIGTGDLSSSLSAFGPEGRPQMEAAIETILRACHRQKRIAGIVQTNAEEIPKAIERGFLFQVISGDLSLLQKGAAQSARAVQEAKRGGAHVPGR